MRHIILFALVATMAAGCSKEKKTVRQLEGTWNIKMVSGYGFYTGDCGTPEGTYDEWSATDAGTITFGDSPGTWMLDDDAQSGSITEQYTFVNPSTGASWEVNGTFEFDWYILAEKLVIENPDEFYYRTYSLDEFDKKSWTMAYSEGDGLGCSGTVVEHELEKQ